MIAFIIKYRTILLMALLVLMAAAITGITKLYLRQVEISKRHERNYNVSQSDLKRFKTENGQNVVRIEELQLTTRELRKTRDSAIFALYQQTKDIKVKDKQIEQLLSVKTKTEYKEIRIPIHDTVIIRSNDTINRVSTIESKYLTATIAVKPNELEIVNYESRDEIVIVLRWYKDAKWFLPRWFERKKYGADIISKNPNSKITQAENIKITKKIGR